MLLRLIDFLTDLRYHHAVWHRLDALKRRPRVVRP